MSIQIVIQTPPAYIQLTILHDKLVRLIFIDDNPQSFIQNPVHQHISDELSHYFADPDYNLNIPFALTGTAFQQRVWQALVEIPRGTTKTYGELAKALNTSSRAIGNACRSNPLPILIPCHRVIAKTGLGGFAGDTQGKLISIKKWLLQHEGVSPLILR